MKRALWFLAIISALFPMLEVQAATARQSITINVSVSPSASVPEGTTVTITASTTRRVSNVWIFDGTIFNIENVIYVTSCDAPPLGGFTRCTGHARHARGVIHLPDPPYRQSKKSSNRQTFFACWDSLSPANCSKPVSVTWKNPPSRKHHSGA